jgi:uncharacterized protein (DUF58 family)
MRLSLPLHRWLFQLEHPEPTPIRLTQRRIFILPTGLGLFYAAALLTMYLGAVNYNLGLGHALVFLLVSIGGVAMVHTFRALYQLEILPGRIEPVFAGEEARFELAVRNPAQDLRPALRFESPGAMTVDIDLAGNISTAVTLAMRADKRGWLYLPPVTLSCRYPLGIFRAWSYPRPKMRCLVYPQPVREPLPPAQPTARAEARGRVQGDEDFSGLRPRQLGDPLNHVAWKAYARSPDHQPLMIKQFSGGLASELWLDIGLLPGTSDLEHRLSVLTGWVISAEAQGLHYGLRLEQIKLEPDTGPRHAALCLETLALFGEKPDVAA